MNQDDRLYEVTVDASYPGFHKCGCGGDGQVRMQLSYRESGGEAKFRVDLCVRCSTNLQHRISAAIREALKASEEAGVRQ
jgi:hypothetical protein